MSEKYIEKLKETLEQLKEQYAKYYLATNSYESGVKLLRIIEQFYNFIEEESSSGLAALFG